MSEARQFLDGLVRQLAERDDVDAPIPTATPRLAHRRLCVGMATYDDFDGVWFTIQAIRMYHPEVEDDLAFVVIDNHPEGPAAKDLKGLDERVPGLRYVPFRGYRSTAVRDFIFREADADIVCCVDSHVLIQPGGLAALLAFFDERPDSPDLVQGPLLSDHLDSFVGSHFDPTWGAGMYGQWGHDERASVRTAPPFEIGMQGLGLFACRNEAWPGINPRFRGFGGEEGYVHEKFRQAGGRVWCLPALRWAHRFGRPLGAPYRPMWQDRIRNYYIGWREIGWDVSEVEAHFREMFGDNHLDQCTLDHIASQAENPFTFFDAIFCLNLDSAGNRWEAASRRFAALDIQWMVERFPAIATPDNPHRGCTASWRAMIAEARRRGYQSLLVLEDDALFHVDTLGVLRTATRELSEVEWDLCYLGAAVHSHRFPQLNGCAVLQECGPVTTTHAVAVHERAFDRILADIPPEGPEFDEWLGRWTAIDQYFSRRIKDGTLKAVITSPRVATQPALRNYADSDLALAPLYAI